ncbi:MAG: hypothetical protein IT366_11615 [Candidatus Hydrogenedentes bacterium]|nr:hypothetical protein [Candidatus Hydrogenedentota bacterium]
MLSKNPAPQSDQNPLLLVHRLLRGRYLLATVLGVFLGGMGAAVGYFAIQPEYASETIIRVAPVLPKVLYENEQNAMMPMFDSFIQTQISLVKSRRVVEEAIGSETWKNAGGKASLEDIVEFMKNITVTSPKGSQLIFVSCENKIPKLAQAAAKSLVDAYLILYSEIDTTTSGERLEALEKRINDLNIQMVDIETKISNIATEFGSENLGEMHAFALSRLQELEIELESAKIDLATAQALGKSSTKESDDASSLTVEQIAATDPRMQQLVDEKGRLQRLVDQYAARYVGTESNKEYRTAVQQLKTQEQEIEKYAEVYRKSPVGGATLTAGDPVSGRIAILDPQRAEMRVRQLQKLMDDAKPRVLELGQKNLEVGKQQAEKSRIQDNLNLVKSRLEQITTESLLTQNLKGRVIVVNDAVMPIEPSNSSRKAQVTILGGLAGSGLGIGFVMLLGLLNPRIRDIVDAEAVRPRLLGALPELSIELSDAADIARAAHCVHSIRMMLQTQIVSNSGLALTITGGTSQTGKTSVALAMGISFASAGARTLLIDGDLIGRGLTRSTDAVGRRKLGHVFREYNVITDAEFTRALALAQDSNIRLGQSLLRLGYINEQDLEDGLALQSEYGLGLADALRGENVENCVADIGITNLHVMPTFGNGHAPTSSLSPASVRALIERLRPGYDVILVDTGPVPGPHDSSIFASSTDGVIMVVSRDDPSGVIRQAMHHLELLNALPMGVIFNRARKEDIIRSVFSVTSVSVGGYRDLHPEDADADGQHFSNCPEEYAKFGPLARAVWLSSHLSKYGVGTLPATLS